jgi:hypothetical protein
LRRPGLDRDSGSPQSPSPGVWVGYCCCARQSALGGGFKVPATGAEASPSPQPRGGEGPKNTQRTRHNCDQGDAQGQGDGCKPAGPRSRPTRDSRVARQGRQIAQPDRQARWYLPGMRSIGTWVVCAVIVPGPFVRLRWWSHRAERAPWHFACGRVRLVPCRKFRDVGGDVGCGFRSQLAPQNRAGRHQADLGNSLVGIRAERGRAGWSDTCRGRGSRCCVVGRRPACLPRSPSCPLTGPGYPSAQTSSQTRELGSGLESAPARGPRIPSNR